MSYTREQIYAEMRRQLRLGFPEASEAEIQEAINFVAGQGKPKQPPKPKPKPEPPAPWTMPNPNKPANKPR